MNNRELIALLAVAEHEHRWVSHEIELTLRRQNLIRPTKQYGAIFADDFELTPRGQCFVIDMHTRPLPQPLECWVMPS